MKTEEWRKIPGFDSKYEASSMGRVRSRDYKRTGEIRIMHPAKDRKGYLRTVLLDKNGRSKTVKVHRIIAATFIANVEKFPQVNHKNGIKTDNRVENLEWVTNRENAEHAIRNGLFKGSFEATEKANEQRKLPVVCIDLENGTRIWYESHAAARRATGCSKITEVLRGNIKKYKNFTFERG